jgi:creatinine amidohydrolase
MRILFAAAVALSLSPALVMTNVSTAHAASASTSQLIEFEMMTWPEVKAALAAGKTTALIYTGGVEQRGPQNATGGHNLMARATVKLIAERLGNAIAMPVLNLSPNNASAELPGTIGLTPELLEAILERMVEQTIINGFKNIVIMGDHGGGQPTVYATVAQKLEAKYGPQGIHVFYCDEVQAKANADFDKWLVENGYPSGTHASIADTGLMLYLDPNNEWVRRDLLPTAVGDPVLPKGQKPDPTAKRVNNGITGDARRATAELGKRALDMKVDYAVKQIQGFIPPKPM